VQRVSGRINLKRNMLTFIVIKLKKKSRTFSMSRLFASGDQNTGASESVFPMSIQG